MANTTKSKPVFAQFSPFMGIDTQKNHSAEPSTADLLNFRILPDGSLQKREGIWPRFTLPGACRAVWTGMLLGNTRTYLLCGNTVCTIVPETQGLISLGTVSTSSGAADFFYYRDALYLCDGQGFYEIENKPPTPAKPYIPLIGLNWSSAFLGPIHEPRNYATRRARISYVMEDTFIPYLRTAWPVESIQGVWVNGSAISEDTYYFDMATESVVVQNLNAGDHVLISLTYAEESQSEQSRHLLSCTRADTLGGIHNSRVLLWNGTQRNQLFPSHSVSPEMLADSRVFCPESGLLYFPEHSEIILGDGRYPITGVCRHYDRLLLFTSEATYKTDATPNDTETPAISEINPYFGCAPRDAVSHCDNDPITVGKHAILRWNADTDEHNECNAEDISGPIRSLLPNAFFSTAIVHYFHRRRELWFHTRGWDDTVWIYGIDTNAWYRFSGIRADCFFEWNNTVAFCHGTSLCIMDESAISDIDDSGTEREIHAVFQSGLLEYGSDREKHALAISLRGDFAGELTVSLTPDVGSPVTTSFVGEKSVHRLYQKRMPSGRFRYATLRLDSRDTDRPIIHSLVSLVR